MATLTLIYK